MGKEAQGQPVMTGLHPRIPDGTKVRHRSGEFEGLIDGLTELVIGPNRNPDKRTQYRINVGEPMRQLAVEGDLLILTDQEGLVLMPKQALEFRRFVTTQLHGLLPEDRFVPVR
jgi:hypothetical protein